MRCPYCHDSVDVRAEPWLACGRCLARHHTDCWADNKACATCRHDQPLAAAPTSLRAARRLVVGVARATMGVDHRSTRRRRARRRRSVLAAVIAASVVANVALGFGWLIRAGENLEIDYPGFNYDGFDARR